MKYIMFSLVTMMALAIAVPVYAETITISPFAHTDECLPDCVSPTIVYINPGDDVTWFNSCNPDEGHECYGRYTIAGGNPIDGKSGAFSTGVIYEQTSQTVTFSSVGEFEYYDPSYKWIQGLIVVGTPTTEQEVEVEVTTEVQVEQDDGTIETEVITETRVEVQEVETEPVFEQKPQIRTAEDELLALLYPEDIDKIRVIHNVGSNIDNENTHQVYYIHEGELSHSAIQWNGEDNNELQFGFTSPKSGTIILKLPNELIGETLTVVSQDDELLQHTYESHGVFSIVEIQLNETVRFTLTATYVTPEYLGIAVLGAVIASAIGIGVYSARKQPALLIKA